MTIHLINEVVVSVIRCKIWASRVPTANPCIFSVVLEANSVNGIDRVNGDVERTTVGMERVVGHAGVGCGRG